MNILEYKNIEAKIKQELKKQYINLEVRVHIVEKSFNGTKNTINPYISLKWFGNPSENQMKLLVKPLLGNKRIKVTYWHFKLEDKKTA